MSPEASSQGGGRFSFDQAPWQREVLDQIDDPEVSEIVCVWASQTTGKTETVNNIIGSKIHLDPCPMLLIQPTLPMGDIWSKDRLAPMLRDTGVLRGKVKDARSKDPNGENTILHKKFPGGHLSIAGANSAASLASRPIRLVFFDEVDRYPFSAGDEGDPVAIAEKRTEGFPDSCYFKISTPKLISTSQILKAFGSSDKRYWFCPCPKCNHWQTLKWGDPAKRSTYLIWNGDDPVTARYKCEKCGVLLDDDQRQAMVRAGEWRPTAPFRGGVRGYHLNGLYCLFAPKKPHPNRLAQAVANFLKHEETREKKQVWINTFLAEGYEDAAETPPPAERLLERCEDYPVDHLPCGVLILTVSGDVQADRVECEIDGWGIGEERWKIKRGVFFGDPEQEFVWEKVEEFCAQSFKLATGQIIYPCFGLFDRRHKGKAVDAWTRKNIARSFFSCQGGKLESLPVAGNARKHGVTEAYVITVGTFEAKRVIYARLNITKPGPGYTHFPNDQGYDLEYFNSLLSERLVTEYTWRGPKRYWKKVQDRNEGLDLAVYNLAAMLARRPAFEAIAKNLAKTAQPAPLVGEIAETKKADEGKPLASAEQQAPKPPAEAAQNPPRPPKMARKPFPRTGGGWMRRRY